MTAIDGARGWRVHTVARRFTATHRSFEKVHPARSRRPERALRAGLRALHRPPVARLCRALERPPRLSEGGAREGGGGNERGDTDDSNTDAADTGPDERRVPVSLGDRDRRGGKRGQRSPGHGGRRSGDATSDAERHSPERPGEQGRGRCHAPSVCHRGAARIEEGASARDPAGHGADRGPPERRASERWERRSVRRAPVHTEARADEERGPLRERPACPRPQGDGERRSVRPLSRLSADRRSPPCSADGTTDDERSTS